MRPERWQRVKELFHAALERAPGERPAFLDGACAGDGELRREVESLLEADGREEDYLDSPAYALAAESLSAETLAGAADGSPVGQTLGHYRVLSLLGSGGMGEVYLAEDTLLGRKVALKLLPEAFTRDEDRVRRFEREARAASALNHPNILTIHEVGKAEAAHFIATEFIDGVTLRQHMRGTPMTVRQALDVAIQVASALAAAHEAGIVHRDVKPENVMLRPDGYVKVLDFGLAKLTGRQEMMSDPEASTRALVQTAAGVVMGTASYMSPEQARGLPTDSRTDVWSLGVVIYEMVTGRPPFEGATTSDVIASILKTEPHPVSRYSAEVPPELERITGKALRKEAEGRYQTAREMLSDLRALKQEMEFQSRLGRASPQSLSTGATVETGVGAAPGTARGRGARPTSSAEYLVTEIARHRRGVIASLSLLAVAVAATAYLSYSTKKRAAIDSLAVLPFTYVGADSGASPDPDREYLSDGITESLINSLSQLPDLRVIARSSVFRYKGKDGDPQAVGRELGVGAVLTGRIIQRGDTLVISAELVNASDNSHIWGEQYSRKLSDLLLVQGDIAQRISGRLRPKLTGEEQKQLAKRYTENTEAYQLYLKGRYFWNKRTPDDLQRGLEYFQQAIQKDPDYALAYAGIADSYSWMGYAFGRMPAREAMLKAREAALKALELDEDLAEAHTSLGVVKLTYEWDWAGTEKELKRAIELNPNYPAAYHFYSAYLLNVWLRFDEATAAAKRGLESDPLSMPINNFLVINYQLSGRHDEAIEQLRRMLEIDPRDANTHYKLGDSYSAKGMYDEAFGEYLRGMALAGTPKEIIERYQQAYATTGWEGYVRKRAQHDLESLLAEWGKGNARNIVRSSIVANYILLGDKDKAFEWLERMYEERDGMLIWLKSERRYDSLRSDPRFTDLLRRVGLPP